MKIIHLSDIHIGKSDNSEKFDSIVSWIIKKREDHKAKVIVLTGDIVDDGSLGQYREANRQIEKLKSDGFVVIPVPGNHDYGTNGIVETWECVERFKKYISDVDYPHVEDNIPGYVFIMLDSMLQEMKDYELWGAQGELGEQQLNELDRILNNISPKAKVIVALHHHPFYYKYFLKLRDAGLFKKVIMDKDGGSSRVNCLLFGHKHVKKRLSSKEKKYNIDVIHASGSSTERKNSGKLMLPVVNLKGKSIARYMI